ncbi:tetraacyldisaccharide 4'-kinase [Pseudidiomarina salinarum]|uniref:tetraacyldisaccharide 4'-kinase n=1 Tax=Pseudidiomarina salinarum TaxID=435908 RepID=UPI00068F6FC3|nr:tetraacyldisaccharide 4'-kinase [Pseudidiomarina salinarum]RUO70137.1 tetraacyldisaccharide 4'-kinase [Pseudidiomarina salinarum]
MWWQRAWYSPGVHPLLWLLLPLHWLFVLVSCTRRLLYRWGWLPRHKVSAPVIVIGNITVGGSGKTPVTEALVGWLREHGWRPGIVARGYGGRGPFPQIVTDSSDPRRCGDEPLLLVRRCKVPVVVAPDRVDAARTLLAEFPKVNIILCDDGLQHYRLQRDIELVVVDGNRGLGNGWRMPLGPLREPEKRLQQADLVVQNGPSDKHQFGSVFTLQPLGWRRVMDDEPVAKLPVGRVVAVAGIGHPPRFFATLEQSGLRLDATREFPDHYPFSAADFDQLPGHDIVVMTEKDAAKCRSFARPDWYYLPVSAEFNEGFWQQFQLALAAHTK